MAAFPGSGPISPTRSGRSLPERLGRDRQARPPRFGAKRPAGRRKGRRLRAGRAELLETVLPAMRLDLPALADGWRGQFTFEPSALWLEIGFGSGEHLIAQAAANPDVAFIGCEPFVNGLAACLAGLPADARHRVRLHDDDGLAVLRALPAGSVARCFILFPDPWPKRRHAERRFIGVESAAAFARVLEPGGELRFASDDPGMIDWGLMHLRAEPRLTWLADGAGDWSARPANWPATRYEAKALAAGRRPAYLRFARRTDGQTP